MPSSIEKQSPSRAGGLVRILMSWLICGTMCIAFIGMSCDNAARDRTEKRSNENRDEKSDPQAKLHAELDSMFPNIQEALEGFFWNVDAAQHNSFSVKAKGWILEGGTGGIAYGSLSSIDIYLRLTCIDEKARPGPPRGTLGVVVRKLGVKDEPVQASHRLEFRASKKRPRVWLARITDEAIPLALLWNQPWRDMPGEYRAKLSLRLDDGTLFEQDDLVVRVIERKQLFRENR